LLAAVSLISCTKSDNTNLCATATLQADTAETSALRAFLDSSKIKTIEDPRGFFYSIDRPGTDSTRPDVCSTITVSYTGRFTNNDQFDANSGTKLYLNSLIAGWKEGLPLITKGGAISLYIPPSLGYGAIAQSSVPAGSYLIFHIELLDVQ